MPDMELGPGCEFSLVGRFDALFLVPPGTTAVEVGPNVGGTDEGHFSPQIVDEIEV
jgi:hypothetical protein